MSHDESKYADRGEIRLLPDHSISETDEQQRRLVQLIDDARAIGCEPAIRKHDHNVSYLLDETRAAYIDLLELQPDEDVLEIGASMGQHTRLIARRCRTLEAMEVVPEQAVFASIWCKEDGLDNVRVSSGGASGKLPFETGSFDAVVMNYVLEWSAGRYDGNPQEMHLRLLSEISRVLRKGGRAYISTKNRYSIHLLSGGVDEHVGLRFGNSLPRPILRFLASRAKMDIPGGYLYSRSEIERLFTRSGFTDLQPYLCFPDARRPILIVPFSKLDALKTLPSESLSKKDRLYTALPRFLQNRVATSHAYIVRT